MTEKQKADLLKILKSKCDKTTIELLIAYFIKFNEDSRSIGQTIGINLVIEELKTLIGEQP